MMQMMPEGRGGATGAEGGSHPTGQLIQAVGAFGRAAAQTPCGGAWGLAREESANTGAAWAGVAWAAGWRCAQSAPSGPHQMRVDGPGGG